MAKQRKLPMAVKDGEIQWDGTTITVPGIYRGIPIDDYHRGDLCDGPSISSGGLRKLFNPNSKASPGHYWATSPYNTEHDPDDEDENKAFILGRAVHHLILGEANFSQHFVVRPDEIADLGEKTLKPWHGNRLACKNWLKVMADSKRTVLVGEMVQQIRGMAIALGGNGYVQNGILSGRVERSYIWKDKETGIWLKWRPDVTPTDSADFTDLKTTVDVRYDQLQRTIESMAYHMQGALGREACRVLLKREMASFNLLFIEKKKPHAIELAPIKDNELDRGEQMNHIALRRFWKCWRDMPKDGDAIARARAWPTLTGTHPQHIELRPFAQERIDRAIKEETDGR